MNKIFPSYKNRNIGIGRFYFLGNNCCQNITIIYKYTTDIIVIFILKYSEIRLYLCLVTIKNEPNLTNIEGFLSILKLESPDKPRNI
jgi:hypothetical protein